jgi:membrane protease YdiL (CAAX protease family)
MQTFPYFLRKYAFFVGKRPQICYNKSMETQKNYQNNLLPSPQKSSGLVFSAATVLPVLFSFVFLIAIAVLGLAKDESYLTQDWYLYANYLLPQLSSLAVIAFYMYYTKKPLKQTLVSQKCAPKYFAIALLMQVGLFALSQLNGYFLQWLENFGYQDQGMPMPSLDGWGFVGVFLVIAVFAAVLEELVFRGALLEGLKGFSTPVAALICGGLFALFHQNPAQTLYQFCCGTAFAFIALRSGSVLPTVLSHFVNNAAILILYKCGIHEFSPTVNIVVISVSLVCLVLAILWLAVWDKNKEKQTKKKANGKEFFLYASVGIAISTLTWLLVLFSGM